MEAASMANEVYANGREVSCKAGSGKTICAFPDVCFTPPENPATPPGVPIPYPNTGMDSDTSDGSKTVKISGQEVMLKNKSYFKRSSGDEAGCAAKKGVLTSVNMGKVYFTAWSMDVKFEGENVVRHLDLTTHNHASIPGNTTPWPYLDAMTFANPNHPCADDIAKEQEACKDYQPNNPAGPDACEEAGATGSAPQEEQAAERLADRTGRNKCLRARRCKLVPYSSNKGEAACCPSQTPHHMVEASAFFDQGRGGTKKGVTSVPLVGTTGPPTYSTRRAPCVCVEGTNQHHGTHGVMHAYQSTATLDSASAGTARLANGTTMDGPMTNYATARDQSIAALQKTFPESDCNEKCLESQLNEYHRQCGIKDRTPIKAVEEGYSGPDAQEAADEVVRLRSGRIR
jgi:hypothetical protein